VRPIAFKPDISTYHCFSPPTAPTIHGYPLSTNKGSAGEMRPTHIQDDGYASQCDNPARHGYSMARLLQGPVQSHLYSDPQKPDLTESFPSLSASICQQAASHSDGYLQTPSSSDSGIGELEMMLREKDSEIQTLRSTIEQNETAIFQVKFQIHVIRFTCDVLYYGTSFYSITCLLINAPFLRHFIKCALFLLP